MTPPSGRKKYSAKYPPHINKDLLPKGIEYIAKGLGFFRVAFYDDQGKQRYKRLCAGSCTITQIIEAHEAFKQKKSEVVTLRYLSAEFQKSPKWVKLSQSTHNDYLQCHDKICNTKIGKFNFGDIPYDLLKPSTILKYYDFRMVESHSRANKELAYIKRMLKWAIPREYIKENVAITVESEKLDPRLHYAEDRDYNFFMNIARESGYWYIPYIIELAYECRLRSVEVLELTDANEIPEGLSINRRKGSRANITLWSDSLRKTWDAVKARRNEIVKNHSLPLQIDPELRPIFISERTGDKISARGLKTAKSRIDNLAKEKAAALGIKFTPFTLHDIKRKSITDTEGNRADKMEASGHKSANMMNIYDVSKAKVKSTRDKGKEPG